MLVICSILFVLFRCFAVENGGFLHIFSLFLVRFSLACSLSLSHACLFSLYISLYIYISPPSLTYLFSCLLAYLSSCLLVILLVQVRAGGAVKERLTPLVRVVPMVQPRFDNIDNTYKNNATLQY